MDTKPQHWFMGRVSLAALLVLVGNTSLALAGTVERALPSYYVPGVSFTLTNTVTPSPGVSVYAVEDALPPGWSANQISDDGTFDPFTHKVKWGLFFDDSPRFLTCVVLPPVNASGSVTFAGVGAFDLLDEVPICGPSNLIVLNTNVSAVVSTLPASFLPGLTFGVTNVVTVAVGVAVYAVEDSVPAGWTVSAISDSGQFDAGNGKVKWGPFFDGLTRRLSFNVTPPSNALTAVTFTGLGQFDAVVLPITGQRQSTPLLLTPGTVVSSFPPEFTPGRWFTVTNLTTPASHITVFAVEDQPPAGWGISNISDGGIFDALNGKVKWGPIYGAGAAPLTYQVLPPAGATGSVSFAGSGSFDGITLPIVGQRQATVGTIFSGSVVSSCPSNYLPGVALTVSNLVTPGSSVQVYAVQDGPPAGWTVASISDGGTLDSVHGLVKWGGEITSSLPFILSYQVLPPTGATGTVVFSGQAQFDAALVTITGQRQTTRQVLFLGSVSSLLPTQFVAGTSFTITNMATPATNTSVYAVEDAIPAGWTATNISDDGVFDGLNGKVKWGPYFDGTPRALTYAVLSPLLTPGLARFSGQGWFDTNAITITGQRQSLQIGTPSIPAPTITSLTAQDGGHFVLSFTGVSGASYTVLASTNLAGPMTNWTALGPALETTGGQFGYTDTPTTNRPVRFYRVRSP